MKAVKLAGLAFLLMFITKGVLAQSVWSYHGRFAGMGNASVMLYDVWGVYNNQAGLAKLESTELAVNYENKFGLSQIGTQSGVLGVPTKFGTFAGTYRRYGYTDYSENNLGLAYARTLGQYISVGIQFDYLFYHQSSGYDNTGAFLLQVGIIAHPVENLQIGAQIYNPTMTTLINYDDEPVNTILRFGAGYTFVEKVLLTSEVEVSVEEDGRFKFGVEYEPVDDLFVRTGVATAPNQYFLGLGYRLKSLVIDISASTHETLPLSSQIAFRYIF